MVMKKQFYSEYNDWLSECTRLEMLVLNIGNNQVIAQDRVTGTCKAYWNRSVKKGWVIE